MRTRQLEYFLFFGLFCAACHDAISPRSSYPSLAPITGLFRTFVNSSFGLWQDPLYASSCFALAGRSGCRSDTLSVVNVIGTLDLAGAYPGSYVGSAQAGAVTIRVFGTLVGFEYRDNPPEQSEDNCDGQPLTCWQSRFAATSIAMAVDSSAVVHFEDGRIARMDLTATLPPDSTHIRGTRVAITAVFEPVSRELRSSGRDWGVWMYPQ